MNDNRFYNDFDYERFPPTEVGDGDYRTVFQIERDRVVFSDPFRRLQSKTQVFQSGEYDFYRTRLTHSIEVAKIGRSICEYLRQASPCLAPDCFIDPDLTEAVGLAHDLGHPPFGHIGERKLNALMADHGGFEGNAQTLRILTELIYERPDRTKGIAPSRALLDGVMKYKALRREHPADADAAPANHFLYDDQAGWRDAVLDGPPDADRSAPERLNHLRGIECQIMDWADDSAYSLHDIVDGVHARYLGPGNLREWAETHAADNTEKEVVDALIRVIQQDRYESYFGWRVGAFVQACALEETDGPLAARTRRHRLRLRVAPEIRAESETYKRIARDLIFRSPQLQQLEFKGGHILGELFDALRHHCVRPGDGLRLLPAPVRELIRRETDTAGRHRRLCDYVAGLTDASAVRIHRRLYDPEFGSIADLF